jgi:hypothetical protein
MLTNLAHHHGNFIVIFVLLLEQNLNKILFGYSNKETNVVEILFKKQLNLVQHLIQLLPVHFAQSLLLLGRNEVPVNFQSVTDELTSLL